MPERGFSLIEVLIATAITIAVVIGATTAVSNALHAVTQSDRHMALDDDALSVLGDVRAASAYDDPATLSGLAGRSSTMATKDANGNPETIVVSISASAGAPDLLATATVTAGGVTVTQRQAIYAEAPAPGSNVNIATPSPGKS